MLSLGDNSEKTSKLEIGPQINRRSNEQDTNLFHRLNDEKNLEDCVIVWLHVQLCTRSHYVHTLRNIVNYLKIFDNIDDCIQYLSAVTHERIFLITSGQVGNHVVPLVHHLDQLYSIYIFVINDELHKRWCSKYSKIRGLFVHEKLLYDQLFNDVSLCLSQIPISIITLEQTSHSLDSKEQSSFLWSQILLQVLLRLPQSDSAKQEMVKQARDQYHENMNELAKIDRFDQTYSANTALEWYTRDCFVYRLVNKALRTENIDNIFLYRFFIGDLYRQLSHMHTQYISAVKSSTLTLYRGQLVSTTELENIKSSVNQYISINTFFSTSQSSAVAVGFFAGGSLRPVAECVLFEISVDISIKTQPFADIHMWSVNQDEEEILFTMGTIFKIESCEEFNEEFWHVKLSLSNEYDPQIQRLLGHYYTRIGQTTSLLMLGEFLHKIHELEKAERYYQLLIRELPAHHVDVGMALNNIGTIYTERGVYKTARMYLQKALKIYKETLPVCHLNVAEIYLNLAAVLCQADATKVALKYERKALHIQLQLVPPYHLTLATTYNNIGDTYTSLNENEKALTNFGKALRIELRHLPDNDPDIAVTYNNMAAVYIDMCDHKRAREYLDKALEIRTKTLPSTHPDIADTHRLIATIADEMDETADALVNYQKSLRILLNRPAHDLDHHRISQVHTDLGLLLIKRKLPKSSLKYFKKCLFHLKQCEFLNSYDISVVYNNIATAYVDLEQYEKALKCCRKSQRIQRRCENPLKCRTSVITHTIRAEIYHAQKRYNKALCLLKPLARRQRLLLPESGEQLHHIYKEMALIYGSKTQFKLLEKYMKKSIRLYNIFSPNSKIDLAGCFCQVGTSYANRKLPRVAIKWYRKSIVTYLRAKPPPPLYLAQAYHFLGEQFYVIDKYSKAKACLFEARHLRRSNLPPDDILISDTYTAIGRVKSAPKRYATANKYYRFALNISEKQEKPSYEDLIDLYSLLGVSFLTLQNTAKAMYHWYQALEIAQQNSLSLDGNERIEVVLGNIYCNIGQVYLEGNKPNKALKSLTKSLAILRRHPDPVHHGSLSRTLLFLGSVYREKECYKQSLAYLREVHHICIKDSHLKQNELLPMLYGEMGLCHNYIGDRQHRTAYKFYRKASVAPSNLIGDTYRQAMKENMKRLNKQWMATVMHNQTPS
jgi:tetratricopeptide (TPR) repeat protein